MHWKIAKFFFFNSEDVSINVDVEEEKLLARINILKLDGEYFFHESEYSSI